YLDDKDYDIGHRYILGNCEFLKDFERLFEEHVIRTYGCINAQDVWTTYDDNFSSWFKGHVLDIEEEVAVEEDELEEDEDEDEDEDEEEEEEEEGQGEDDEEEEDNNDDGGAADNLDGIMTYRSRGGLNGRGAIIRPRSKVAEACVSTELETTSHGVQNQNRQQQQQQQHVLATVTEQPIEGSEDNQNHQSETHIANDDTLGHEDVNVGQGITVSDDTVDAVVETSYKTYFKGPYYNWGVTPAEVKDRWWNAFKHEFSWDPLIASLVKKEWQSKCARRLSGIASKVCTDPSYKATWCAPALRAHMKKIRQEDEDFKRRSSQCSKNRLQNESQRVHHRTEKELARLPTAPELYYDGHVDNDGQFVNPKAKQVWDEFQKKKAANLEFEDETRKKSEDELFFEVVGGWNEKGRIFGLGAAAHSYYDRPTCEEKNGKKSRREYIKSLETQVVELAAKNDDQQKELDQTKQELDQTKQELGETKQGLVDTQTNLVRTQEVLIETKKHWPKPPNLS
ncbi:Adventurous-gliding motility protein Z, partial [Bienertia sinuspersici]